MAVQNDKNVKDSKAAPVKGKDAAAGKEPVEKKPRGRQPAEGPTIASVATEAILAGKDNDEALEAVLKVFPDAKTKKASINWYRNKIREENPKVKTSRDITKARNAEKKAAEKAEKAKAKAAAKDSKAGAGKGKDVDPTA